MASDLLRLGGPWRKDNGNLSGPFTNSADIIIMPNRFKKSERDPDFVMLLAPKRNREQPNERPDAAPPPASGPPPQPGTPLPGDEDIPF